MTDKSATVSARGPVIWEQDHPYQIGEIRDLLKKVIDITRVTFDDPLEHPMVEFLVYRTKGSPKWSVGAFKVRETQGGKMLAYCCVSGGKSLLRTQRHPEKRYKTLDAVLSDLRRIVPDDWIALTFPPWPVGRDLEWRTTFFPPIDDKNMG